MFEPSHFSKQTPIVRSISDAKAIGGPAVPGGGPRQFADSENEGPVQLSLSPKSVTSIPLERLLAELDTPRDERKKRDLRPAWLRDLVDCVADLFEPLAHAGRVGFDCLPDNGRWQLSFYLGAAEHIGGALDGHVEAINFRFDVAALMKCFERVDRCEWRVFPSPDSVGVDYVQRSDIPKGLSSFNVEGVVMTETGLAEPVAIEVHSLPPASANVGLRVFADGGIAPRD